MFGRGSWAVLGLAKESLDAFQRRFENRGQMLAVSQLAASAVTRQLMSDAVGVNPFGAPRLDEKHALEPDDQKTLAHFATAGSDDRDERSLPSSVYESAGFAAEETDFQIHDDVPWYGLWAVLNQWKDISDLTSIKEQHSYEVIEKPYKFLESTERKSVDADTQGATAAIRKQVAVLLDFNEGRVYIENTSKKIIFVISEHLKKLGLEIFPLAWTYNRPAWPSEILNRLHKSTQFQNDIDKRAQEAARFTSKEIEKLDDRELEKIVATYFSMTELPNDIWVGIKAPAQIRLHQTSQSVGVRAATSATTLLSMTEEAHIVSGALTFQERISYISKKGEPLTFRKDMVSLDLNDQINLTEIGAAMLRGFDIPSYRKDILREIKKTKQTPSIKEFWGSWLQQMSSAVRLIEAAFREVLELDGEEKAGLLPMQTVTEEELLELETV
jgi:hypothetical protein